MKRMALMLSALLALVTGCSGSGPYSQKDGQWRFEDEAVAVPRGETLKALNNRFAKSKSSVFFRSTAIEGADPGSFEALSEHYAKDRSRVFYGDTYREGQEYYSIVHTRITPIAGADAASFTYLEQGYARDRARVYYEGTAFAAHAPTYAVLDYGFGKDEVSGYYMREPIPGSDGKSFAFIDNAWSKDATRVFWSDVDLGSQPAGAIINRTAEGADPATFQALEQGYGKDAAHVFFEGVLVEGADAATFKIGNGGSASAGDAEDKHGYFRAGTRLTGPPPQI
jgi:hypothetical protein